MLAASGATWLAASGDGSVEPPLTAVVARTDLELTATERGLLESVKNIEVKCELSGGGIIEWIVPDGTIVNQGDPVARLDSAALEILVMTQEIAFERSKAAKIQSEQAFALASIAVQEYLEGTFVNEVTLADTTIVVAEEALRSARNTLTHNQALDRKGYITPIELEASRFAVRKAELDLETARTARRVLAEYTKPRALAQLESARDAGQALMLAARKTYDIDLDRLERLRAQLAHCEYVAPESGMIVHANEESTRRSQGPTIQEGGHIRQGQIMVRIPDMSQMQVKVYVHESKVENIQRGQAARVWVQGRELAGTVTSVGNQPARTYTPSESVKEYYAYVKIDGSHEGLRPGMTAQVEILVGNLVDVLAVDAAAIIESDGAFSCWVRESASFVERAVRLGASNSRLVSVLDGLSERDEVLLNPRTVMASLRHFDADQVSEKDVRLATAAGALAPVALAPARRKVLEVTYRGTGLINSVESISICCLVPGEPTIAWIIDDGVIVEQGQELVQLDGSQIEVEIGAQEVLVARADAIQKQAAHTFESARAAVDAYLAGEYRQLLKAAEIAVTVADQNRKTSQKALDNTRQLARQGFATQLQLEAQEFAARRADLDLAGAETTRNTLVNFTKVKTEKDLHTQRDIAEATMRAEQAAYKVELAKLELLRQQLANCTYKAPRPGLVIHANSSFRRMEPGASLYYSRQIIRLPDLAKMHVELKVHESAVDQLKLGMPAVTEIFGQKLRGRITSIGNQPAPQDDVMGYMPLFKEYLVQISLDAPPVAGMKPGMTADVTVHISRADGVITVPVDAVVEQDARFYCWIKRGLKYVLRPVVLGQTNLADIEIRDGVAEGERVVVNALVSMPETRIQALTPARLTSASEGAGRTAKSAELSPIRSPRASTTAQR